MDHRKLFQVLVVGGALLGASCREEDEERAVVDAGAEADAGPTPVVDAGGGGGDAGLAGDAGQLPEADAGLEECGFCPNDVCCETGEDGVSRVRDGFMCCWGTSC